MQRTTLAVLVGALVVVSSLGSAGLVMGLTDDTAPTALVYGGDESYRRQDTAVMSWRTWG